MGNWIEHWEDVNIHEMRLAFESICATGLTADMVASAI